MSTVDLVKAEISKILPEIVKIRHSIHERPEIALCEHETAALVREVLKPLDLSILPPFLETDVVAVLYGNGKGRNITLRADMDALPLEEKTGLPYASKKQGLMHACGHDGHTAMLIGAAIVLSRFVDRINGSVRFVFQPGEEVVAAGKDLVGKGALLNPEPDGVFALHGWSGIPEGTIASKPGVMMAASDFFSVTIKGKGAHGSRPEEAIDPILTAARIVEGLQSIVSRSISPLETVVVSVCRISSGTNANIIPENAEIEGTIRYLNSSIQMKIRGEMERIIKGTCDSMGASFELSYNTAYKPTVNDQNAVLLGQRITKEVIGSAKWMDLYTPSMGSEDFAYYIEKYPGAMFRLGLGEKIANLHNPYFDFNDKALGTGILFLVSVTLASLMNQYGERTLSEGSSHETQ